MICRCINCCNVSAKNTIEVDPTTGIAEKKEKHICRVAPRISELLNDYQAIYISGYTKTSSGCTARTYRATDGVRAND